MTNTFISQNILFILCSFKQCTFNTKSHKQNLVSLFVVTSFEENKTTMTSKYFDDKFSKVSRFGNSPPRQFWIFDFGVLQEPMIPLVSKSPNKTKLNIFRRIIIREQRLKLSCNCNLQYVDSFSWILETYHFFHFCSC